MLVNTGTWSESAEERSVKDGKQGEGEHIVGECELRAWQQCVRAQCQSFGTHAESK